MTRQSVSIVTVTATLDTVAVQPFKITTNIWSGGGIIVSVNMSLSVFKASPF